MFHNGLNVFDSSHLDEFAKGVFIADRMKAGLRQKRFHRDIGDIQDRILGGYVAEGSRDETGGNALPSVCGKDHRDISFSVRSDGA